ncbi:MAG TPA: NAD(P)-binding domain-containing protein [Polyangiaceae bacterium]|nr:NAD(P)-binding domain-containing protein [Polyangiaceae bacterium]
MKIAVLGTGSVGQTIGSKLVQLGHEVRMGSRSATHEKGLAWVKAAGASATLGTFADAAAFGELAFNCTSGFGSVPALESAAAGLKGKLVIDIANPLDFSKGFPPTLFTGNTDSLGEQAQRALPDSKVVKALNTVTAGLMVDARRVAGGDHEAFICGNDAEAKAQVTKILQEWFGWQRVLDLGDISKSRGTESYLALWIRLYGALGTADFNVKIMR